MRTMRNISFKFELSVSFYPRVSRPYTRRTDRRIALRKIIMNYYEYDITPLNIISMTY